MPTTTVDSTITCVRGSSFNATINWTSGGTAVNLTGYTGRLQVRSSSGAVFGTFDLTIVDGVFNLALTPAQTRLIPVGMHVWGMEFTSSGGQVTPVGPAYQFRSLPEAVK